jgi:hypothetical protein
LFWFHWAGRALCFLIPAWKVPMDLIHACGGDGRNLQVWLFPHLILAALPVLITSLYRNSWRVSLRGFVIGLAVAGMILYSTIDGWELVSLLGSDWALTFWWDACKVSGLIAIGISAGCCLLWSHMTKTRKKPMDL